MAALDELAPRGGVVMLQAAHEEDACDIAAEPEAGMAEVADLKGQVKMAVYRVGGQGGFLKCVQQLRHETVHDTRHRFNAQAQASASPASDDVRHGDQSTTIGTGTAVSPMTDRGELDGSPDQDQDQQGHVAATKPQICFDFTKGMCTRGDKCRYSHDLATIVHFNSKEKGICFDWLRNQCQRGLLCRFSHDLSNIAQQCQVFHGTATKGRTSAICFDFVKGVCTRGNECRYSHDLSLIARTARGGANCLRPGEVCYDHLRGRCSRGSSCKYSHNMSFLPGYMSAGGSSNASGQTDVDSLSGATQAMLASAFGAYPPNMQMHQYGSAAGDGDPRGNPDGLNGCLGQPPMMWPGPHAMANQPGMGGQAAYGRLAQQQFAAAAAAVANFNGYAQHLQQQAAASAQGQMGMLPPQDHMMQRNFVQHQAAVAARAMAQAEGGGGPGAAMFMQSAAAAAQLLRPSSSAPDELLKVPGRQEMTPDALSALLSSLSTEDSAQLAESLKGWNAMPVQRPQGYGHRMSESGAKTALSGPSAPQQIPRRSVDVVAGHLSRLAPDRAAMETLSRTAPSGSLNPSNYPPTLLPLLKEIWNK